MTDNSITKTGLDYINRSPLDYWWRFINPDAEPFVKDKKTLFDDAFKCAVLRPKEFSLLYVRQPTIDRRTTYGKAEYESLMLAVAEKGQILLPSEDYDTIVRMTDAVWLHPSASRLFNPENGKPGEYTRFEDLNSGVVIRFTPDWISQQSIIVNLLSTSDAGSENFSKEANSFKLHKRAAIQMDGIKPSVSVFVMVEKEAPYKLQVHCFDDRSIDLGRREYVQNCITYMECLQTGKWPGLPEKINMQASLPDWAFKNY